MEHFHTVNIREFAKKFDVYSKYNQQLSVDSIIENLLNKDEKFKLIKKNQNQCNKISKKFWLSKDWHKLALSKLLWKY